MSEKIASLYFWYTMINGIAITLSIAASPLIADMAETINNTQDSTTVIHYNYATWNICN